MTHTIHHGNCLDHIHRAIAELEAAGIELDEHGRATNRPQTALKALREHLSLNDEESR